MLNTTTPKYDVDDMLNVMVVDDQESMRSIVRQLLSQQGIRHVSEAENGIEAYTMMHDPEVALPDVIICDLHMEGMDGVQFTYRLREEKDPTPILILTGDPNEMLHQVAEQVGANKVLTKPISAPDLAREIHQAVGYA